MSVYVVSKLGRRPQNEDEHKIIININNKNKTMAPVNFFGLYDGHGGRTISKYLADNLFNFFTSLKVSYPLSGSYIRTVFKTIQDNLIKTHKKEATICGSTCIVVIQYIHNNKQYIDIANLGDSRCVLCNFTNNKYNAICITQDHKPNILSEKKRIEGLGGCITFDGFDWRVGDLSVSRSFGDLDNTPFISSIPDLFRRQITKNDKFIIIACDGLWDVVEPIEAINIIVDLYNKHKEEQVVKQVNNEFHSINKQIDIINTKINKKLSRKEKKDSNKSKKSNKSHINYSKYLAEYAYNKGSLDNISIIVVFFNEL